MKKIFITIMGLLAANVLLAQPQYSVNPPTFTAEDEITLTVDVSGTSLANYDGDVWIWSWIAEGCSASCDAPTNIDPAGNENTEGALMTRDLGNPNIYTKTLVLSAFFNKPPSEIKKFGLKLKSASWGDGKQSDVDIVISVEPLIFTPRLNRIFPTKVTKDDVVTLYLDQSQATDLDLKYELSDFSISITGHDAEGNEVGSAIVNADAVNQGNGVHYYRILPTFSLESSDIAYIRYRFISKDDTNIQSDEFELVFFN